MPHSPALLAVAALLGLAVGALVVRPLVFAFCVEDAWRRSCPHCGSPVLGAGWGAFADLVMRRCRTCSPATAAPEVAVAVAPGPGGSSEPVRIGPAALLPEVLTAAAVWGIVAAGAGGWLLAAQLWVAVLGSAMLLIDLQVQRLPNLLTGATGAGVALLLAGQALTGSGWQVLLRPAVAVVLVGGLLFLAALFGLLGLGDVKLAPGLVALLAAQGWATLYWGVLAQFVFGFLQALVQAARAGGRRAEVAFGPGLIVGTLVVSALAG
ncbi:prepilin peptidase [Kitasatospora sp. NPDC049285]|uniref:prepilin peptidase n=1 Tax=Kitasatospora sp. NPDC049285 TaxID=3157096 RepID=UPI00342828F0